ncbi:hypothetical protein FB45DRAFT_1029111 [Roridomyces roridus]|uniref:Uncharacterized protein n=1 Tax=Roridomyces roridus TaxID=1738132 RepID=A0AAD7FN83_9AGAR|nr:hypothetical protein FB45DRAFT_1029111 [Roridomyces roridus]
MSTIPLPWPSETVLSHLVNKSSGYFIYAATVINDVSPFKSLDQLYRQILSRVPIRYRPRLLATLSLFFIPKWSSYLSIRHIAQLLHLEAGDIRLTMRGLHSVFEIDSNDDSKRITPRHASFRDFLVSKERSSDFYIGSLSHRFELARAMLGVLSYNHRDSSSPDHVVWMVVTTWVDYITSLEPCDELLPLIRAVNLDFLFLGWVGADYREVVKWIAKTPNCPKDLLELWERVPEGKTQLRRLQTFAHILNRPHKFRLDFKRSTWVSCARNLLDLSWPQMLALVWNLQFFEFDLNYPWCTSDVYKDVAVAYARLFRKISDGEISLLPSRLMEARFEAAFRELVDRYIPSDSELLYELDRLSSNWTELSATRLGPILSWSNAYCILKWLQTSPACPLELVRRWELSVSASNPRENFTLLSLSQ